MTSTDEGMPHNDLELNNYQIATRSEADVQNLSNNSSESLSSSEGLQSEESMSERKRSNSDIKLTEQKELVEVDVVEV